MSPFQTTIWIKNILDIKLKGKFPQTTKWIGWVESNFRNPTVKFWANLDNPFKRTNYAKFCMSPSLDGTMPESVISQENNSPLTLYIKFHSFFSSWISIVQLIKFNYKCMHNHLFFLSFNFYWTKSNNHYKDQVSNYTKNKGGKKRQSSLIAQEFYNISTNTDCDIIQWNLAIKRSDTTKSSHNLTRQPCWTQALNKFLCFFTVTQC